MKYYLTGMMGSGKSHWARLWAAMHHLPLIELDDEIEKHTDMAISDFFKTFGEEKFREVEAKLLRSISCNEDCIISCGGGTPCYFNNMEWMNETGITIYLKSSVKDICDRLHKGIHKRPLLQGKNKEGLEPFVEEMLLKRAPFYEQAKYILDTTSIEDDTFAKILKNEYA